MELYFVFVYFLNIIFITKMYNLLYKIFNNMVFLS